MIHVGIAGLGFMGMIHYLSYQQTRGVRVAAICERNGRRLEGDWRNIRGNFGPAGRQMDLTGIAAYDDLDAMLSDKRLDFIDITLPPHLHADIAVKALQAGKHVFCEKPLSLSVEDCVRMIRAARREKMLLLIGHVLPFFPEYAWALKIAKSGRHGKLKGGSFKRVISDPNWLQDYWRGDRVGGPMLDLHVHDAHFIRLLFGMPMAVTSTGRLKSGLAEFWHSQFDYGPRGPIVQATSGTIPQSSRPFNHGFEIQFEHATALFEFATVGGKSAYLCPPTLLTNTGKVQRPRLVSGDPMNAFSAEIGEVVRCVHKGISSEYLDAQSAHDAVRLCQLQTKSLQSRRPVRIR